MITVVGYRLSVVWETHSSGHAAQTTDNGQLTTYNRGMRLTLALTLLLAVTTSAQPAIDRILREVPLIDGHNDLPWQYRERAKNQLGKIDLRQDQSKLDKPLHTDIARLRQGGIGAQFWSVFVPTSLKGADAVQATL